MNSRRPWRLVWLIAALLVLPPLLAHPATGPQASRSAPDLALLPRTEILRAHVSNYSVAGTVDSFGTPPSPVNGIVVTLADQLCAGGIGPTTCPTVNHTTTNATGSFAIGAPNGSYFVYVTNSSRWGGDWRAVDIIGTTASVSLLLYPWVPYGNATYVLPAWNNLSSFVANCNAALPCTKAPYGTQVPVLSWTQDGAIYVNATDELVFYSFINRSVEPLGAWLPLYDNLMGYDGIENTEWVTQDGSFAYEFGCLSLCNNASIVSVYALNLSTGHSFEYNFTGFNGQALYANAQVNLIGRNGNDSIAAVTLNNGSIYAYGLWNETQWILAALPYFEANNLYWLPSYNAYLNVQAEGSTADAINEYQLVGAGAGSSLVSTYAGHYTSSYISNGVDGIFLNISSHQLVLSESRKLGDLRSQLLQLSGSGVVQGSPNNLGSAGLGVWPVDGAYPNSYSSEHRPSLVASGPMFMGFWNGLFDNNSWLYDPATGSYLSTNVSFDDNQSASLLYHEDHQNPNQVEGLFFNATYSILGASVDCQSGGEHCPLRGTSPGTVAGTVWWTWRLGQPEFPYPASAGRAETLPPSAPTATATNTSTSVTLVWTPPSEGAHPILNYTLTWGNAPTSLRSTQNLPGSASSYTIAGLLPGETVFYSLVAWNLHWHGPESTGSIATLQRTHLISSFLSDRYAVDVGVPLTLTVSLSSVPPAPQFSYLGLPTGCPSIDGPGLVCVPSGAGVYPVTAVVTLPNGTADYANLTLTVNPDLAVLSWTAPSPVGAAQSTAFAISIGSTGTAPFVVRWSFGDGTFGAGFSVTHAFSSPGAFLVTAAVTDVVAGQTNYSGIVEVLPPIGLTALVRPNP
ncbi:MAG: fibronectin type III domain-containing protein, partial [Thermoplasmata archaeon]|nr:fibronectin type III domain-containing protein [Thermoplasmata archaeon]